MSNTRFGVIEAGEWCSGGCKFWSRFTTTGSSGIRGSYFRLQIIFAKSALGTARYVRSRATLCYVGVYPTYHADPYEYDVQNQADRRLYQRTELGIIFGLGGIGPEYRTFCGTHR